MFSSLLAELAWLQNCVDEPPPTWASLRQPQRWPEEPSMMTGGALEPQIESWTRQRCPRCRSHARWCQPCSGESRGRRQRPRGRRAGRCARTCGSRVCGESERRRDGENVRRENELSAQKSVAVRHSETPKGPTPAALARVTTEGRCEALHSSGGAEAVQCAPARDLTNASDICVQRAMPRGPRSTARLRALDEATQMVATAQSETIERDRVASNTSQRGRWA